MKTAATTDIFAPRVFPYLRAAVDALPPATPDLGRSSTPPPTWSAPGVVGRRRAPGRRLGQDPLVPASTIYRAWRTQVQHDTFDDELGTHNRLPDYASREPRGDNQDSSGDLFSIDALFLRALAVSVGDLPDQPRLLPRRRDAATNPGRDATLVGALRTAITTLTTQFGTTDPTQWLTPKITVEFDEHVGVVRSSTATRSSSARTVARSTRSST